MLRCRFTLDNLRLHYPCQRRSASVYKTFTPTPLTRLPEHVRVHYAEK